MNRHDTIIEMLRRYREAEDNGTNSIGGNDTHTPRMPTTWNHSYQQLETLLNQMAHNRPKQHRHLVARYIDPTHSRRRLKATTNRRGEVTGWIGLDPNCEVTGYARAPRQTDGHIVWDCLIASWPTWVRNHIVELAINHLEHQFHGEPFLPTVMLTATAA